MRHTAGGRQTWVTPDHRYFVGDLNTTATVSIASRGYAALLQQPTRLGQTKLVWKPVGALERDVLLVPAADRL